MKDKTFVIILLLFGLIVYLGNDNIIKRSNELLLLDSINVLNNKFDSLKTSNIELYNYSNDLEDICNKYKSSRDEKYNYHLRSKIIME